MEPTPLRVDKIKRILEMSSRKRHFPTYPCGAAHAQAVGPPDQHLLPMETTWQPSGTISDTDTMSREESSLWKPSGSHLPTPFCAIIIYRVRSPHMCTSPAWD